MLLGFISLLLTVGQAPISNICISKSVGATWHPCSKKQEDKLTKYDESHYEEEETRRKLLAFSASHESLRRVLAAAGTDKCAEKVWLVISFLLFPFPLLVFGGFLEVEKKKKQN